MPRLQDASYWEIKLLSSGAVGVGVAVAPRPGAAPSQRAEPGTGHRAQAMAWPGLAFVCITSGLLTYKREHMVWLAFLLCARLARA